eukprot:14825882-Ditylum_brightwellii.AAC.1
MHADGSLSKHKARLCCCGGKQQWGVNLYKTYAPVVAWASERSLLIMSKLHNLNSRSIDFVLVYPQAEVKTTIYLASLTRIEINTDGEDVVFRLQKNLYGLKDAGRTWWEHLSLGIDKLGFRQ